MRSRFAASVLALSLALTGGALAQPQQHQPSSQEQLAHMQAVQDAAQAQAVHPGDDQLTCDQLQQQMMAAVNDPTVQQGIQANGAIAQQQQAQLQQEMARQRQQAPANVVGNMVMSMVPGGGYAQMAAAQAQQQHAMAQAAQNQAQAAQMQQNMEASMPQMMRGQHLYELAQQKQCAWAQQQQQPSAGH